MVRKRMEYHNSPGGSSAWPGFVLILALYGLLIAAIL